MSKSKKKRKHPPLVSNLGLGVYSDIYITVVGDLDPTGFNLVCSRHKNEGNAQRAAARCEKAGGLTHTIWHVARCR